MHTLSVKASLTNGKPFNIELRGETIDKDVGIVSPLIRDNCLFPTPINVSFPVTNQIFFKNSGTSELKWKLDRSQIKRTGNEGEDIEDIDVLEDSGELKSEQLGFVTIIFKPHKPNIVNIDIPLQTEDINGYKSEVWIKARCMSYNPDVVSLSELQNSNDPETLKYIPNSKVPVTRTSNSQLLTAAMLSNEEILFDEFIPNDTRQGIT